MRIMIYVPSIFVAAILWYLSVSIVSLYFHFQVGSFKDSVNVALGAGSVVLPYLATSKRLKSLPVVTNRSLTARIVLAIFALVPLTFSLIININFFRFAGLYFKLTLIQLWISSVLLILLCLVVWLYLRTLSKFIKREKTIVP